MQPKSVGIICAESREVLLERACAFRVQSLALFAHDCRIGRILNERVLERKFWVGGLLGQMQQAVIGEFGKHLVKLPFRSVGHGRNLFIGESPTDHCTQLNQLSARAEV